MSTTIDRLEVEISSTSSGASKNIDELAKSLKKLSKNGDTSNAVDNLNNLRKSLQALSSVQSPDGKIASLAKSLKALKKIGNIDVGQGLKKSMESLKTIDAGGIAPQIEKIANAFKPLSNIKGSGFNSMMSGLKKLDDTVDSLDSEKIDRFVAKIKELDEKLGPVSTKLVAIGNAFKGVNSAAINTSGGMSVFGGKVNTTSLNLANLISVAQSAYASLQPIIKLLDYTISEAIEWDGIASRFGRGFGDSAEETYKWIQRLNKEMGINVQQFMQYSSVYATMLTGFGVATKDATQMALGYTELTYDIWAGYNDIYKNFSDAAEAVKSAIAGEVEPIRRAGFTIVEATLEQTAANHGLKISLENATEAQKSYLRYLTLVDQAHAQNLVGTYAKELNTAEGVMRTFAQQLKTLAQTFGSVFLPILVRIMPWLSAFVEVLGEAIIATANFFGIDIQTVDFSKNGLKDVESDAEGATNEIEKTEQAIKELKNATLGIDELNVISPTSSSANSGTEGSGDGFDGLDVGSLWDESIFDSIQSQVDEIKEKIKGWLPVIGMVTAAFAAWRLIDFLGDLDEAIKKIKAIDPEIKNIGKVASAATIAIAVGAIVLDFTNAYLEGGDEADLLKAIGSTAFGTALAAFLAGKKGAAMTLAASGIVTLTSLTIGIKDGTVEWDDPEAITTGLVGLAETAIAGVLTWQTLGPAIKKALGNLATSIKGWFAAGGAKTLFSKLAAGLSKIPVWGWIAAAVLALIAFALSDYDYTEIGKKIGEIIGKSLRFAFDLTPMGLGLKFLKWLKEELDLDSILEAVVALFKKETWTDVIFPKIEEIFKSVVEWVGEKIENFRGNVNELFGGFFEGFFDSLGWDMTWVEDIAELFDIDFFDIFNVIMDPMSIGKKLVDSMKAGMENSGIKDKLSSMWTTAKDWWDTKKSNLAAYTPNIGDIKSKLSSAWSTAKTWWDNSKAALSAYTPSIGSISSKLSSAWTTAKTWWDKSKSALASYTPSIGSIKDRLVSAWNTAKEWWNKNVKLSIPSLSFKVTYTTKGLNGIQKAIVNALGLDGWPKLSFAANGGIFDAGSLIWAGEAGAEVVANAGGGRTGVMNVEQMQNAVYEGVYAAVTAAMRANGGNGGSQAVNVYLDSRQITASVENRQHERGASIMGRQVYA